MVDAEQPIHAAAAEVARSTSSERQAKTRETVALILMSVTALLTAWCGFQASKWGGEMSIAFSQASAARIEGAKQQGIANNARQEDLTVFGVYLQANAEGNEELSQYIQRRFSDGLRVAFNAWNDGGRQAKSPFGLPAYVPPGTEEAAAADQRADELFAKGLENNKRADNYTILTVLAALVLFFAAISARLRPALQWAAVIFSGALFLIGVVVAVGFPVLI